MTRKQALNNVLLILAQHKNQTEEIIEIQAKIKEIIQELPLNHWSEASIFDAITQFIIDNGRIPNTSDMKRGGLPPHPVIKLRFGMEVREFLDTYFPNSKKCDSNMYWYKSKEEWLSLFINEYEAIKPSSAEEYNKLRQKDLPSWGSVARLYGITKWSEFQKYCNLPIYTKEKTIQEKKPVSFEVKSYTEYDDLFI